LTFPEFPAGFKNEIGNGKIVEYRTASATAAGAEFEHDVAWLEQLSNLGARARGRNKGDNSGAVTKSPPAPSLRAPPA
jgi:hypothetical protein